MALVDARPSHQDRAPSSNAYSDSPDADTRSHLASSHILRLSRLGQRRRHGPKISAFREVDVDGCLGTSTTHDLDHSLCALDQSGGPAKPSTLQRTESESSFGSMEEDTIEEGRWPPLNPFTSKLWLLALIALIAGPLLYDMPLLSLSNSGIMGVSAGIIPRPKILFKRDDSPTDVCNRWSHQSAVVNGTLYIYGGHASQQAGQAQNTWTNDFITIDLNNTWQISTPTLKGLPKPSGPPPVSNAYLWNSADSLYLYGGEFSDKPQTSPVPFAMWEYDIGSGSWIEHENPTTSAGDNSDGGNQPVQRAAEGAGAMVPDLGRGYYFAGHLDGYTTAGWSQSIARVYLKSLIEFTLPGYSNGGVQSLGKGKTAGSDGVWRNVTQGGIQDTNAFTNRADGVLVHVPGFGDSGILLSLGGGTNVSFSQMNVIDVFDIASSTWYKQATSGEYPILRVNPCAVAASAPDGSSTNIYMYGGQNLIPYGNQTQYGDMWILTVPSFTWIKVDTDGQSVPPPRVGHTCNLWDGQIVVVGGYVGPDLGCDTGFYVFSASNLTWQNQFTSISGGNTLNQQTSQEKDPSGLSGSFGYQVPGAVQKVIGGHASGGATITAPAQSATAGPLATGKPITYTVTGAHGAVVTETSTAGVITTGSQQGHHGPNVAAIVAGVIAGCFAVLAAYLGFCTWVYRRQLALYKRHVAMSQTAAIAGPNEKATLFQSSEGSSDQPTKFSSERSSAVAGSRAEGSSGYSSVPPVPPLNPPVGGNSTANSSNDDLISGSEPSFVGVLLNPRRSLRVINRD